MWRMRSNYTLWRSPMLIVLRVYNYHLFQRVVTQGQLDLTRWEHGCNFSLTVSQVHLVTFHLVTIPLVDIPHVSIPLSNNIGLQARLFSELKLTNPIKIDQYPCSVLYHPIGQFQLIGQISYRIIRSFDCNNLVTQLVNL
jgi:hypothetical protein